MKISKLLIILLLISISIATISLTGKTSPIVNAQTTPPQTAWTKTYGGTGNDFASSLIQTSEGGYAIAGYTGSFSNNDNAYIVTTDSAGNMQWNKTYGGTGGDYASSIIQTKDGGFAFAGSTDSYGAGRKDGWLVKLDSAGNMQWNQTYGGTDFDVASSVIQTSDSGFALSGITNSTETGGYSAWLIKADSAGIMQWNKTYGLTGYNPAYSVIQTTDGGYALAGATDASGAGSEDAWLIKTDNAGNMQWNQTFGGTGYDYAYSVVQTNDGYALAGAKAIDNAGNSDFWLIKTDSTGSMQWNTTYGGTGDDQAFSLAKTNDGGYALAGYTTSFGAGGKDFWFVKTDSAGSMQWSQTYGGTKDSIAYSVIQTTDAGYALGGQTSSFGSGGTDFYLVKTETESTTGPSLILILAVIIAVIIIVIILFLALRKIRHRENRR